MYGDHLLLFSWIIDTLKNPGEKGHFNQKENYGVPLLTNNSSTRRNLTLAGVVFQIQFSDSH